MPAEQDSANDDETDKQRKPPIGLSIASVWASHAGPFGRHAVAVQCLARLLPVALVCQWVSAPFVRTHDVSLGIHAQEAKTDRRFVPVQPPSY
ncbi:hypothetical protein Phou_041080 [Phytohabitans houttuyneae]|uniref:Uncharacterized protein n=1 Tax=Phytohabitans houttuyneae TaxID=1076126 RepID=A0A6V8KC02_9ACTN|nr:hypothetical protein Phou_041080 [Phytohabitans houttuyneae]